MQINLEPSDLKVLIQLLGKAKSEFAQHICNDFDLLKDAGLAPGEAEEMKSRMQAEFPGEEVAFDRDTQSDWLLMRRFQKVFEKALKSVQV